MTLWWLEQDRIKGRPFGEPREEMVTVWARGVAVEKWLD